ncbi:MAG: DUF1467 family protein [Marivivens sp.]|jgi:predicted secreted protein|uniref:DUF1467 family protein n=1 Tax=Marivivens sp. TaxID=1978374 RepID=UPI00201F2805|nr:DUF1467 family protein [Marivivens sp.]MCL7406556.1 DUF1467 family protein [Marivivens geojensis]NBX08448.1 DUF1467 family protein [Marivivens sp.]
MAPTSAFVLFAVIWFMVFFIVLPLRLETQGEAGEVVKGTHASSPANFSFKRKAWITTMVAVPLWGVIAGVILSGLISVRDLDWFHRMSTPEVSRPSE